MRVAKEVQDDRKKIEDLLRERDILNKNVIKADERTKGQIDLVKERESVLFNVAKDVEPVRKSIAQVQQQIKNVEVEREKYGIELSEHNAHYFKALEELKRREERIASVNVSIAEVTCPFQKSVANV